MNTVAKSTSSAQSTIDGADLHEEYATRMIQAISPLVDIIYTTNARSKRVNLRNMMANAKELGLLHEITCFMDSDTIPDNTDIAKELLRPFVDPAIGGVTTCQRIKDVNTIPRIIADWVEFARIYSSMGTGSLLGQVGCLPGRLYAVRSDIVQDKMDELVDDWWKVPFSKDDVQCFAGDDRVITNFVLKAGYKTIMMPAASIKTCMPLTFFKMFKQWECWGQSSQGYTLRTLGWSWKQPWILFQNTTDILITLSTAYILSIHWVLLYFVYPNTRPQDERLPISTSMLFFFFGSMLTVFIRQGFFLATQFFKHRKPWILLIVPVFFVTLSISHFIRCYSLFTPHKIGVWGTRDGTDSDMEGELYVRTVYLSTYVAVAVAEEAPEDGINEYGLRMKILSQRIRWPILHHIRVMGMKTSLLGFTKQSFPVVWEPHPYITQKIEPKANATT